jgi:hypothetical protein
MRVKKKKEVWKWSVVGTYLFYRVIPFSVSASHKKFLSSPMDTLITECTFRKIPLVLYIEFLSRRHNTMFQSRHSLREKLIKYRLIHSALAKKSSPLLDHADYVLIVKFQAKERTVCKKNLKHNDVFDIRTRSILDKLGDCLVTEEAPRRISRKESLIDRQSRKNTPVYNFMWNWKCSYRLLKTYFTLSLQSVRFVTPCTLVGR